MNADLCPNCGAVLPVTGDAFCSECRQALEDLPALEATPEQDLAAPSGSRRWLWQAVLLVLGIVALIVKGAGRAFRLGRLVNLWGSS